MSNWSWFQLVNWAVQQLPSHVVAIQLAAAPPPDLQVRSHGALSMALEEVVQRARCSAGSPVCGALDHWVPQDDPGQSWLRFVHAVAVELALAPPRARGLATLGELLANKGIR